MKKININPQELEKLLKQGLTNYDIAEYYNCHVSVIERRKKKLNLLGVTKVKYELMTIENPIFCYLLGWFITDGYLTKGNRVSLRIRDKEPIVSLCEYFGATHYEVQNCHELYFAKAPSIFKKVYYESKTFDCIFPDVPYKNMLLRGILEGDGCIRCYPTNKSTLIRIYSASTDLIKGLDQCIRNSLGYNSRVRIDRNGFELASNSLELLDFIYSDYLEFVMPRKYNRAKQWLSR